MAVPYTFGSATTSIPLSQLDSNFATTITLGNTAIQLGNTVTTLNNMTLANVTVSSGNATVTNANVTTLTATNDATISGLTVGKGGGAVATNTAVGASALQGTNTAGSSTAVGYQAGYTNTSGTELTAIGYQAGYGNTSGSSNTSVGWGALKTNSTGSSNHAFGSGALNGNTTGNDNVGIGLNALVVNTTGSNNVAIGRQALQANTTASNNTAVGYQAGYTGTTGTGSVYLGQGAGYSATSSYNTIVGREAGYNVSSGGYNTFLGQSAGYYVTTGAKNTVIGQYNGNQGGLDIRTRNNAIVLSDGDGNPRAYYDTTTIYPFWAFNNGGTNDSTVAQFTNSGSSTPYGVYVRFSATSPNNGSQYFFQCVDTVGEKMTVRSNGGIANYSANNVNLSDRREKTNFAPSKSYLNTICSIPVQTFNYINQNLEQDDGLTLGVLAQDVQAVAPELVMESNWGTEEEPKMRLSIYQTDLQYALMKALQELKAEFDAYKATHP